MILQLSALEQASLIRKRKISSAELLHEYRRQIESINPKLNAAIEIMEPPPGVEGGGPFQGVPFSVKDSIEVAGTVCSAGTIGRRNAKPSTRDATLVARLKQSGALLIARTNLPDLLFSFESDNLLFGRTNNPYDVTRTSGGSSGGEAALIASCGSAFGLGSDAAGSVRVPAAFCGIASIKPTSGRLPRTGHFPPAGGWLERLWQIGPMARYVRDLRSLMPILAQPDGLDETVIPMPFDAAAALRPEGVRVAFYTSNGYVPTCPAVADVVRDVAKALAGRGCVVTEDRPGCLDAAFDLEMKLIGPDGGDALWRYLEQLGSREIHPLLRNWLDRLEPYRTDMAGLQRYWSELDTYRRDMLAFLQNYDAIVAPVYTQPALPHGASAIDENFRGFSHTMAYNLCGWPAAVVRAGTAPEGLPIGVQVIAAPWREDIALTVAEWVEESLGGWRP